MIPLKLEQEIATCAVCAANLPHGPRPIVQFGAAARLLIIGQAPGRIAHETGIPWNDASGNQLRAWLQMTRAAFYDAARVAIVPMGLCYPGRGNSGDLAPRPECAPLWHARLLDALPEVRLTLLIGRYAQAYYLRGQNRATLTDTLAHYNDYLPRFFPLPHPSPRNRFWLSRNPWFAQQVLPALHEQVRQALDD